MSSASEVVAVFSHWKQHVQRVSHLQVGIVSLLTGCQRHSNPVACNAAETTPGGRGRQQYSSLTKLGHSRVVWLGLCSLEHGMKSMSNIPGFTKNDM